MREVLAQRVVWSRGLELVLHPELCPALIKSSLTLLTRTWTSNFAFSIWDEIFQAHICPFAAAESRDLGGSFLSVGAAGFGELTYFWDKNFYPSLPQNFLPQLIQLTEDLVLLQGGKLFAHDQEKLIKGQRPNPATAHPHG